MKFIHLLASALTLGALEAAAKQPVARPQWSGHMPSKRDSKHLRPVEANAKREFKLDPAGLGSPDTDVPGYVDTLVVEGQPERTGKFGSFFSGGTNPIVDEENPSNLGQEATDNGNVPNVKWRFSDSKTRPLKGGWVREQLITDLPASTDIAAAQLHLKKGAVREMHWHRVAEWGLVYAGQIGLSAVDENGQNQYDTLSPGDIWYFPKGQAHAFQGIADESEFLVCFDDGNFESTGTTFMVDDWLSHTPKDILAKNFGVNASIFNTVPSPNPYIAASTSGQPNTEDVPHPFGELTGNSSYVIHNADLKTIEAPGGGGTIQIADSRNFPIAQTIASSITTVKPGAMRELHWHPTAQEWIYFAQGQARATVFLGSSLARTFDFSAGDTAVFPDNSGHYVINTSNTTDLIFVEIYKADRVADISLTQWLALTPAPIVAQLLNISESAVKQLKQEKQYIIS